MEVFLKARDNDLDFFYKNPIYLDIQDELGHSLLHYAIFGNATDVFFYLLNNNINPNLVNKRGETPIFDAIRKNKREMIISLLNKYAKVNILNYNNESPLFIALSKGNLEITKMLIESKAKIEEVNKKGESILFEAIKGGSTECYEYIRLLSPNYKKIDHNGNTLLHLASSLSNSKMLKYLLENGDNPHLVNNVYETAIFNAVRYKYLDNVTLLLKAGAYVDLSNKYSHTLIDLANENGDLEMISYLKSHQETSLYQRNLREDPLRHAVLKREEESILKYKNKTTKDKYNFSGLDYANNQNNKRIIKLLKQK